MTISRRKFVKGAAYAAPAVVTLKAAPAYASYGSGRPRNDGPPGGGPPNDWPGPDSGPPSPPNTPPKPPASPPNPGATDGGSGGGGAGTSGGTQNSGSTSGGGVTTYAGRDRYLTGKR